MQEEANGTAETWKGTLQGNGRKGRWYVEIDKEIWPNEGKFYLTIYMDEEMVLDCKPTSLDEVEDLVNTLVEAYRDATE